MTGGRAPSFRGLSVGETAAPALGGTMRSPASDRRGTDKSQKRQAREPRNRRKDITSLIPFLIEPVGQIVQRIGQKWLRPPLESSTPEVALISGGRKYIRSKSLFLRRDHTCSCNFPGSVPDYIPYSKLLFNYNKGLSMPHGHYQAYQQSYLRIV